MEPPFSLLIYSFLLIFEATPASSVRPMLTVTCKLNRDCNWQALCWNGKCEKAKPSDKGDCISDDDCSRGDGCRYGICFTLIDIPASDSTNKTDAGDVGCRGHGDCPKYSLCTAGSCSQGEPTNDECKFDGDCPHGGACWDQLCWYSPGKPADDTAQDGTCSVHEDCSDNMLCDGGERKCKAGVPAVDCETKDDCGRNAFCKNNKCLKFAPECREQEDCKGKKLCDNGKCVAGEMTKIRCGQGKPCGNNEKCKFFFCWKLKDKTGSQDGKEPSKDATPEEEKGPRQKDNAKANDTMPSPAQDKANSKENQSVKEPSKDATPEEEKGPQQKDNAKANDTMPSPAQDKANSKVNKSVVP